MIGNTTPLLKQRAGFFVQGWREVSVMEWLMAERWSPYAVGIGIGILSWAAFFLSDKPIGVSTAFARTAGMVERFFLGPRVLEKRYYKLFPPVIDWEWMLVVGIIIGSLLSALWGNTFHLQWVPDRWNEAMGSSPLPRWLGAVAGGIFIGIGSRWAGGCTSGHGISGTLQLAVSSWLAVICFFISGIATATIIYGIFP